MKPTSILICGLLLAACAVVVPCVHGQSFVCGNAVILEATTSNEIPGCLDTLHVSFRSPIPESRPSPPPGGPAWLFAYLSGSMGSQSMVPVPVTSKVDRVRNVIEIVPDQPLPIFEGKSEQPILYRLVLNCRTWEINPVKDTAFIAFSKQGICMIKCTTRCLEDSSVVKGALMQPANVLNSYQNPIRLMVSQLPANAVFDRWTCSNTDIVFDERMQWQDLGANCWPLQDTVFFTAWIRRTSGVVQVTSSAEGPKLRVEGLQVSMEDPPLDLVAVHVYDARGVFVGRLQSNASCSSATLILPHRGAFFGVAVFTDGKPRVFQFTSFD